MKLANFCFFLSVLVMISACKKKKDSPDLSSSGQDIAVPEFVADSAYLHIVKQCGFGPRVTGTEAHQRCGEYIISRFQDYGLTVSKQEQVFRRYDGVKLPGYNIIAVSPSSATNRILVTAHWDSRPWADHDTDPTKWKSPISGANDGASGVAVMLEMARILKSAELPIAVDFVCFDAEDAGVPEWDSSAGDSSESWCLGSRYWANNPHSRDYRFGILLDMVGGQGARFYREGYSVRYASHVVDMIFQAAQKAGYSDYFVQSDAGFVTDDHVPVNTIAKIPMADVIAYYPTAQSGFGPTWHTFADDAAHIDRNTLKAVGQTMVQLICSLDYDNK